MWKDKRLLLLLLEEGLLLLLLLLWGVCTEEDEERARRVVVRVPSVALPSGPFSSESSAKHAISRTNTQLAASLRKKCLCQLRGADGYTLFIVLVIDRSYIC